MEYRATLVRDETWHVAELDVIDENGTAVEVMTRQATVAVRPGEGEAEAIALAFGPQDDPDPAVLAEMAAAEALAARKAECRARIVAVCDQIAQINLAAAAAAGALTPKDAETHRALLAWVDAMRAACATGDWPDVPAGVAELAAKF